MHKLSPDEVPDTLYHGTADRFLDLIQAEGLKPMGRQHVHLSGDTATAVNVASRHGKPFVLRMPAKKWPNKDTISIYQKTVYTSLGRLSHKISSLNNKKPLNRVAFLY